MKINYAKKEYTIDINKVFDEAKDEEFLDFIEEFCIIVHSPLLAKGYEFLIAYDDCKDIITVFFVDMDESELYKISEKDYIITDEERKRIVKELSFHTLEDVIA